MKNKTKVIIELPDDVLSRLYPCLREGESLDEYFANCGRKTIVLTEENQMKKEKGKIE